MCSDQGVKTEKQKYSFTNLTPLLLKLFSMSYSSPLTFPKVGALKEPRTNRSRYSRVLVPPCCSHLFRLSTGFRSVGWDGKRWRLILCLLNYFCVDRTSLDCSVKSFGLHKIFGRETGPQHHRSSTILRLWLLFFATFPQHPDSCCSQLTVFLLTDSPTRAVDRCSSRVSMFS